MGEYLRHQYELREQQQMEESKTPRENINHPAHYNVGRIEVIDAIESWELNFSRGNAVKYIARAGHKGDEVEDLKKAAWYINREIERLKRMKE